MTGGIGHVAIATGISTHTLTWSVTDDDSRDENSDGNFNSHAHVERDVFEHLILTANYISTHTLTWSVTISRSRGTSVI